LDCRLKPVFYSGGEGGGTCKGKIAVGINPCPIVDFSSQIFLAQLSLRKSLIYWVCNFHNLGTMGTIIEYSMLSFNWKK